MNAMSAVGLTTLCLIIYILLVVVGYAPGATIWFLASPFLVLGMVYIVLKDGRYDYPELAEGEEWGYSDKSKDELGLF
jgi:hypothetical protein